jgi:hypothetical protein
MKQLLLAITFILGTVFMSACSNKPDNEVHNIKQEEAGWTVEKPGANPVMKYEEYYLISPTWGQAQHYASKRPDHLLFVAIGLILLIAFGVLFYGKSSNASWLPESIDKFSLPIMFILSIGSLTFLTTHQAEVKWQNNKWIKKDIYHKAIIEAGSTQPIWDSLENNHLIIGGSWK